MLLFQQGVGNHKVLLIPQDPYQPQVLITPEPVRSTIPKRSEGISPDSILNLAWDPANENHKNPNKNHKTLCIPYGSTASKRRLYETLLQRIKSLNTHRVHPQNHMTYPFKFKPLRDQVSYKQHEAHIMDARDRLCAHYKLNKSDLVKYLIKKEDFNLRKLDGLLEVL